MSAQDRIVEALAKRPMRGEELRKAARFSRAIYVTLMRMEDAGLIVSERIDDSGRRLYRLPPPTTRSKT